MDLEKSTVLTLIVFFNVIYKHKERLRLTIQSNEIKNTNRALNSDAIHTLHIHLVKNQLHSQGCGVIRV